MAAGIIDPTKVYSHVATRHSSFHHSEMDTIAQLGSAMMQLVASFILSFFTGVASYIFRRQNNPFSFARFSLTTLEQSVQI